MPTLNWIGKEKVINHHLDVPFRTLKAEYAFGDAETAKDNLIIHGDNLEALKALPSCWGDISLVYTSGSEDSFRTISRWSAGLPHAFQAA